MIFMNHQGGMLYNGADSDLERVAMPIYEYCCEECRTEFQELVLSKAAELAVVCSKCNSSNITRLISGAAVKSGSSSSSGGTQSSGGGGCGGHCSCH